MDMETQVYIMNKVLTKDRKIYVLRVSSVSQFDSSHCVALATLSARSLRCKPTSFVQRNLTDVDIWWSANDDIPHIMTSVQHVQ